MNEDLKKAGIIVYGNYIERQDIQTQINNYGEEKKPRRRADENDLATTALKGFVEAGLIDEHLMPDKDLSRGQKAVLAQVIAARLNMTDYWPYFENLWGMNSLRSDCSRFKTTKKYIDFQRTLNAIK